MSRVFYAWREAARLRSLLAEAMLSMKLHHAEEGKVESTSRRQSMSLTAALASRHQSTTVDAAASANKRRSSTISASSPRPGSTDPALAARLAKVKSSGYGYAATVATPAPAASARRRSVDRSDARPHDSVAVVSASQSQPFSSSQPQQSAAVQARAPPPPPPLPSRASQKRVTEEVFPSSAPRRKSVGRLASPNNAGRHRCVCPPNNLHGLCIQLRVILF